MKLTVLGKTATQTLGFRQLLMLEEKEMKTFFQEL